jgi:hypothetical protein
LRWYPRRLALVRPPELPIPGLGQRLVAVLVALAILVFVAVAYVGPSWQLYAGALFFLTPLILKLRRERFPNSRTLYEFTPKGVIKISSLVILGSLISASLFAASHANRELLRDAFVLLAIPEFLVALMELVGRQGATGKRRWHHRILATMLITTAILFVLGLL